MEVIISLIMAMLPLFIAVLLMIQLIAMTYGRGLFQNSKSITVAWFKDNKVIRWFFIINLSSVTIIFVVTLIQRIAG